MSKQSHVKPDSMLMPEQPSGIGRTAFLKLDVWSMSGTLHSVWPKRCCEHVEVCVELAEQRDEEQQKDASMRYQYIPFPRFIDY